MFDKIEADLVEKEYYNLPGYYYFYQADAMFSSRFTLESYGTVTFLIFFVAIILIVLLTFAFGQYETHFGPEKNTNNDYNYASKLELNGEVTSIRPNLMNLMMVFGVMVTFVQYGGLIALGSSVVSYQVYLQVDQPTRSLFSTHIGYAKSYIPHIHQCWDAHLGRWYCLHLCLVPHACQEVSAQDDLVSEQNHVASILLVELLDPVLDPGF